MAQQALPKQPLTLAEPAPLAARSQWFRVSGRPPALIPTPSHVWPCRRSDTQTTRLSNPNPNPNPVNLAPFFRQHCTIWQPPNTSISLRANNPITQTKATSRVFCSSSKSLLYLAACLPTMLVHAHHMTPSSLVPPIRSIAGNDILIARFRWSRRRFFLSETPTSVRTSRRVSARLERAGIAQTPPPPPSSPQTELYARVCVYCVVSERLSRWTGGTMDMPATPSPLCRSTAPRTSLKGPRTPKACTKVWVGSPEPRPITAQLSSALRNTHCPHLPVK